MGRISVKLVTVISPYGSESDIPFHTDHSHVVEEFGIWSSFDVMEERNGEVYLETQDRSLKKERSRS